MNKSLRLKASFVAASLVVSIAYPLSTMALVGNGAPSGTHYNLNIIGVPKGKTATITTGNRIFVNLSGNTKINLIPGETFAVKDGNGTDGSATFQLPNPDPDGDGTTVYSVYARALGKPDGKAQVVTCATDSTTLEEVCSTHSVTVSRSKGKNSFTNVSKQLLYIFADLNHDGNDELVPLFDERLQGYLWSYDNYGLKVLQLRFYPISTDVNK